MPADVRARIEGALGGGHGAEARRLRFPVWAGWLAAAACLTLAVAGWWPRLAPAPTLAQQRDRVLAAARDTVRAPWAAGPDPAGQGVSGEVDWSPAQNRGFVTFRNLARNDPSAAQYQLWVFDAGRPQPVDGGVFDVTATGEVVIPLNAKLPVSKAAQFA